MLDHAIEAEALSAGRQRQDLDRDRMFELAVTRLLEIVGEAASKVSPETRDLAAGIPWRSMIGLRNRLIHAYDAVDREVLWQVISEDLPVLRTQLNALLTAIPPDRE
jgi:uncharacterized protein with HEPN domain